MSMVYESIIEAIDKFNFGDYGLDEVEDTKYEYSTRDWVYALAAKIKEEIAR
jgi:hypothetical protein